MSRGRAPGPGRLWKRDRSWVLDFTDAAGKRSRRVLGTDKRVAERRRHELINRRDMELDGLGSREGQALPISEVLELYLEDLRPRVTVKHFGNVSARLLWVVGELGEIRVRDLKPMDLVRVRNKATLAGNSNRTANLQVDRLRAMLNWAVDSGVIAENPVARLKRLPTTADHQVCRRRALTDDEIDRFIAASEWDDYQNAIIWDYERVPQTPMWIFLVETGARYGEMRQILWGDVDLGRGLVTLRAESTKARKQRVIPLRPSLVEQLRALKVMHEGVHYRLPNVSDPVFLSPAGSAHGMPSTNINRVFRRLLDRAGIARIDTQGRKLDVHSLRHTCATRMARNGVSLFKAQRILGHSDPKLTAQVYTHIDAEDLRSAIEALPSIGGSKPAQTPNHISHSPNQRKSNLKAIGDQ